MFSRCTKKQLGEIATLGDLVYMPAGTELVKEGGSDRDFVVIVEGGADVKRGSKRINTLSAGGFFGEIAVVAGGPRTATVATNKPSTLLVIGPREFWAL